MMGKGKGRERMWWQGDGKCAEKERDEVRGWEKCMKRRNVMVGRQRTWSKRNGMKSEDKEKNRVEKEWHKWMRIMMMRRWDKMLKENIKKMQRDEGRT